MVTSFSGDVGSNKYNGQGFGSEVTQNNGLGYNKAMKMDFIGQQMTVKTFADIK